MIHEFSKNLNDFQMSQLLYVSNPPQKNKWKEYADSSFYINTATQEPRSMCSNHCISLIGMRYFLVSSESQFGKKYPK